LGHNVFFLGRSRGLFLFVGCLLFLFRAGPPPVKAGAATLPGFPSKLQVPGPPGEGELGWPALYPVLFWLLTQPRAVDPGPANARPPARAFGERPPLFGSGKGRPNEPPAGAGLSPSQTPLAAGKPSPQVFCFRRPPPGRFFLFRVSVRVPPPHRRPPPCSFIGLPAMAPIEAWAGGPRDATNPSPPSPPLQFPLGDLAQAGKWARSPGKVRKKGNKRQRTGGSPYDRSFFFCPAPAFLRFPQLVPPEWSF